jgi:hypothetical protein
MRLRTMLDPAKIDFITLSPDGSTALLYIVVDSKWSGSDDELDSLMNKIDNYVGFATDGQMTSTYPETAGLAWNVVIDFQSGAPDARTSEVLEVLGPRVESSGGALSVISS